MDWKILVAVIAILLAFGLYQMCSEDDEAPDWDKKRAEQLAEAEAKARETKAAKNEDARNFALEAARKVRGDRPAERTATLENDDFAAVLSTKGGSLKSFELKNSQFVEAPRDWSTGLRDEETDDLAQVNLVTTNPHYDGNPNFEANAPLRFEVHEGLDGLLPDADYEIVSQGEDEIVFRYDQPDLPVVIKKKFELDEDSGPNQIWLTISVRNRSDARVSFLAGVTQTGYQHESEAGGGLFSRQPNLLQGICRHNDSTYAEAWKEMEGPFVGMGKIDFTGVETNYFISAMIPGDDSPATCRVASDVVTSDEDPLYGVTRAELRWGEVTLQPGQQKTFKVKNYIGPKRYQVLQSVGHDLEESVDFGWFWPISRGLLWLLFFFQRLVVNWGVAIILLTIVVKLALMPLTHKSFKSSDKMKALKPEVDKINEKYKDDPQEKQKQIMALYKQNKINPLGGCIPMVLQMPIWFALFRTLRASPELYHADFFGWITDLSSPDPYFVTPIVMGAMMFLQQQMMPMAGDNTQAKVMKYFMPIMFTGMMLFLPSGLTLYILVNTVLSILHQLVIHKMRARAAAA